MTLISWLGSAPKTIWLCKTEDVNQEDKKQNSTILFICILFDAGNEISGGMQGYIQKPNEEHGFEGKIQIYFSLWPWALDFNGTGPKFYPDRNTAAFEQKVPVVLQRSERN